MHAFKVTVTQEGHRVTLFGIYAHSFDAWFAGLDLCTNVLARITVERDR